MAGIEPRKAMRKTGILPTVLLYPKRRVLYTDFLPDTYHPTSPYPAVLINGPQPLHSDIPDVASPKQDLPWKKDETLMS